MKATLTIQMDNAAFGDWPEIELAWILRTLSEITKQRRLCAGDEIPTRDSNGNTVGSLIIEED